MILPTFNVWKFIGIPAVIIGVGCAIYYSGYNQGANKIKAERLAERSAQALIVAELKGKITQKEKQHAQDTAKLRVELAFKETVYKDLLGSARNEFVVSLRDSEQRANRYRALSQGDATQCRNLASHAAGLDRSIVEGQSVVKELRATIEFRDTQVRALGAQILSDRQLYENNGTDRN
jgi:hypothetical protein